MLSRKRRRLKRLARISKGQDENKSNFEWFENKIEDPQTIVNDLTETDKKDLYNYNDIWADDWQG